MIGAPWFYAPLGAGEAFGQRVELLEAQLYGHMALILAEHFLPEVLFEVLTYDEHYLAEAGLYGVVNRIVHYRFAVGAEPVKLFQAAVTAAHSGSQQQ